MQNLNQEYQSTITAVIANEKVEFIKNQGWEGEWLDILESGEVAAEIVDQRYLNGHKEPQVRLTTFSGTFEGWGQNGISVIDYKWIEAPDKKYPVYEGRAGLNVWHNTNLSGPYFQQRIKMQANETPEGFWEADYAQSRVKGSTYTYYNGSDDWSMSANEGMKQAANYHFRANN